MQFQRVKEGFSFVFQGCYNFGRVATSIFSDSRWTGLADVAGAYWMGSSALLTAVSMALKGLIAVALITTAPLTAMAALGSSVLFGTLACLTGATALGFLKAAQVKSGISFGSAKSSVQGGMERGMKLTKEAFTFSKKPAADFKKSADAAPSDKPFPTPPAPKDTLQP